MNPIYYFETADKRSLALVDGRQQRTEQSSRRKLKQKLLAKNPIPDENCNDQSMLDADDIWLEIESIDGLWPIEEEEPDAYLNDDDLSLLHNIGIPSLSTSQVIDTNVDSANASVIEKTTPSASILPTLSIKNLDRQLSSDLSYYYLRDELGIDEDIMWKITNEAGSILGLKVSTVREKVDLLQNKLQLSNDELRHLISSKPSLLLLSAQKNLSPKIHFLQNKLDLSIQDLRTLTLACPSLLSYSTGNLERKMNFFQDTMKFSVEETRKLFLEEPRLLSCSVETGLLPRYKFLRNEVQIPREEIRAIVQKNPLILLMSVERSLQPKVIFYLIMTLSFSPEEVRKILLKFPKLLDYSLEEHLLPIHRYFLSLDISATEYARMLFKFPRLITNSLAKIKHMVGYLRFELGLQANDVRRILYQAPQVVSLSMSNLEAKVDFFSRSLQLNTTTTTSTTSRGDQEFKERLRKLIVGMPTILKLNIDSNMAPKIEYLKDKLGGSQEILVETLIRLPTILGYSLDKRLRPRMEKLITAGVDPRKITVGITMKEEVFEVWLEGRARKSDGNWQQTRNVLTGVSLDRNGKSPSQDDDDHSGESSPFLKPPQKEVQMQEGRVVQEGGRIVHWTRPRQP